MPLSSGSTSVIIKVAFIYLPSSSNDVDSLLLDASSMGTLLCSHTTLVTGLPVTRMDSSRVAADVTPGPTLLPLRKSSGPGEIQIILLQPTIVFSAKYREMWSLVNYIHDLVTHELIT